MAKEDEDKLRAAQEENDRKMAEQVLRDREGKRAYVYDREQMALVPAQNDAEQIRGEVFDLIPQSNPEQNIPVDQAPVPDGGSIDGPVLVRAPVSALFPSTPSNPATAPPLPGTRGPVTHAPAPTATPVREGQQSMGALGVPVRDSGAAPSPTPAPNSTRTSSAGSGSAARSSGAQTPSPKPSNAPLSANKPSAQQGPVSNTSPGTVSSKETTK